MITPLKPAQVSRVLWAATLWGAAAGGHQRRCRSSEMSPHRLRRDALHLPTRRSRHNANLFLREPLIYYRDRPGSAVPTSNKKLISNQKIKLLY
jgi:hypothetical protein